MSMMEAGVKAPDFALKDQHEKEVRLSFLQGKKVLLSFHPLAWTSICAAQMKSLEANREIMEQYNTVALGLSVDAVPTKAAWAKELGIEDTHILADFWPHGGVAAAYGIFREKNGFSERANIIVDEKGNVAFIKIYPISELPDIQEILSQLENM